MTQDFTSVIAFFNALKAFLTTTVALTLERTLSTHDLIYTDGTAHLRLTRTVVSPTVSAISLRFGPDADTLETTSENPECCLPFNTADLAQFSAAFSWTAESRLLNLTVFPGEAASATDGQYRRYKLDFDFAAAQRSVYHADHTRPEYEPDFGSTAGPYIESGA